SGSARLRSQWSSLRSRRYATEPHALRIRWLRPHGVLLLRTFLRPLHNDGFSRARIQPRLAVSAVRVSLEKHYADWLSVRVDSHRVRPGAGNLVSFCQGARHASLGIPPAVLRHSIACPGVPESPKEKIPFPGTAESDEAAAMPRVVDPVAVVKISMSGHEQADLTVKTQGPG